MSMGSFDEAAARQGLSALADGEAGSADTVASCETWSRDATVRRDWHAWHLIGDVLRSEDLASDPRADRQFCAAVFARLASEAVVLAPSPRATADVPSRADSRRRSGRSRWTFASAVAAGFFLVAGTFALLRPGEAPAPAPIALADGAVAPAVAAVPAPAAVAPIAAADSAAPPVAVVADNRLIRDAQLDGYLVAHKQFAGISALGVPSVFLRSATVDSASR
jgi:sigma-E factor negative regulatory protein RseA